MPATGRLPHSVRDWPRRRPRRPLASRPQRRQNEDDSGSEFSAFEDFETASPDSDSEDEDQVQPVVASSALQVAPPSNTIINVAPPALTTANAAAPPVATVADVAPALTVSASAGGGAIAGGGGLINVAPVLDVGGDAIVEAPAQETSGAAETSVVENSPVVVETPLAETSPVVPSPGTVAEATAEANAPENTALAEVGGNPELEREGTTGTEILITDGTDPNVGESIGIVIGTMALLTAMIFVGFFFFKRSRAKKSGSSDNKRSLFPTISNPFRRSDSGPSVFPWKRASTSSTGSFEPAFRPTKTNSEMINTVHQAAFRAEEGLGASSDVESGRNTNYFNSMEGYWGEKNGMPGLDEYHQTLRQPGRAVAPSEPVSPRSLEMGVPAGGNMRISLDMPSTPGGNGRPLTQATYTTNTTKSSGAWYG